MAPLIHIPHSVAAGSLSRERLAASLFDGRGPWRGSPRTSIWCLHDQVLAKSMTAMPLDDPASLRPLTRNRSNSPCRAPPCSRWPHSTEARLGARGKMQRVVRRLSVAAEHLAEVGVGYQIRTVGAPVRPVSSIRCASLADRRSCHWTNAARQRGRQPRQNSLEDRSKCSLGPPLTLSRHWH